MMSNANSEQLNLTRPAYGLVCAMFALAAGMLAAAFTVPAPEIVIDILWGFSFCLAGAAIMICFGAENSSDLRGFVPVMSGLILLRLAVLAATARRIIHDEPTGILVNSVGHLLDGNRPLGMILFCLLLAVIGVVIIFASCQKIAAAANNYIRQILPLKRTGLKTDLQTGIINEKNARTLSERIISEYNFFSQMNGTSLLMRAESAVCIFVLLGCLLAPTLSHSDTTLSGVEFIGKTAPTFLTLSAFTLLPAVIIAAACGRLMSKETLALRMESKRNVRPAAKKITIISNETGAEEQLELLNPEFVEHKDVDKRVIESVVEFEPECIRVDTTVIGSDCHDAADYYNKLCELIVQLETRPRIVLFASNQVRSLPATVAVNVAISLAQKHHRVLLVDADIKRHSIAQIFEMDSEQLQKEVVASCLENLSVHSIPADNFGNLLEETDILNGFDTTLVYMPDTAALDGNTSSTSVHPEVFYFTDEGDSVSEASVKDNFCFGQNVQILPDIQSVLK